ncbi:MAG: M28 family metallopeptidase [Acidobacteriota bacterium]|nr:M28 family metallopeptidase [Acidobacteriota bacterium]
MRTLFALAILLLGFTANAQQFRTDAIRAHMTFLASDMLEGRGTGSRGHRIAAEYVAAQYALAGLEPGANGSWYQEVPFVTTAANEGSTVTLTPRIGAPVNLKIFDQFVSYGDPLFPQKDFTGDIVVAGYGVTAPTEHYDDYARIDVKGKIVAIFPGGPKTFPNALRAHHSSSMVKLQNAAAHGAIGLIYLTPPAEAERVPWERNVRQSRLGSATWLGPDGAPRVPDRTISSAISLNPDTTRLLLGSTADATFEALAKGEPKRGALPYRATVHLISSQKTSVSPNVVGLLRGSDPKLRDEYIVYSSHLDHLGISAPVEGDAINNGAFDNASGIAAMLEIARAFASMPARPRRSILFLATTGEEKGSKGADYFANNPTVPVDAIAGNINIDMLVMTHRMLDLVAYGAETNDLGDIARDVAKQMHIELSPDPFPQEMVFVRSDQYAFVRRGIPAIYLNPGFKAADPNVNGEAEFARWLRTRYHSPKDDMQQPIDWPAALLLTEFDYRLGLAAANRDARPQWKPGDFFGQTFARR